MTEGTEEITVSHEKLGARKGVLIVIREIDRDKIKALGRPVFRVERQWNRGKSKEVLIRNVDRGCAEGFVRGVVAGIKLAATDA